MVVSKTVATGVVVSWNFLLLWRGGRRVVLGGARSPVFQ